MAAANPDILLAKATSIYVCLKRIRDTVKDDVSRLSGWDVQDIVVLNLQRAVQQAIDMAMHVVMEERLGLPQTLKDSFRLLEGEKILTSSLAKKMSSMVGFRNIAVHDYQTINFDILKSIVTDHLKDLEDFCDTLLKYFRGQK